MTVAYSSKFVLTVLRDNAIQKELADGVVPLPYGSEFAIRLRNKHDRRAVVRLFLDGEEVSGGGFIVPAKDKVDIFRPTGKDAAFRFVALDSPEAADFGKSDNRDRLKGVVEARFSLEKEVPAPMPTVEHHHHYHNTWPFYTHPTYYTSIGTYGRGSSCSMPADYSATISATNASFSLDCTKSSTPVSSGVVPPRHRKVREFAAEADLESEELGAGCTVEGARTGQVFRTVHFVAEPDFVSIKVILQGFQPDAEVARESGFCLRCGSKRVEKANFCGTCGDRF